MPEFVNPSRSHGLVDILDRVLDKGLVVAGDIKINLANVELLTIQLRFVICSVDKARELGLDWWSRDTRLGRAATEQGSAIAAFGERLSRVEQALGNPAEPALAERTSIV